MKKCCLIAYILFSFINVFSQEIINNNSVLSMIELGFDETLIVDKIKNSDCNFDTSISALGELMDKGVSKNILSVMVKSINKKNNVAQVDSLNDLKYSFSDGAKNYTVHLVKDKFYEDLNGLALESIINSALFAAKMELKNMSTYNPTFVNLIRDTKKNENIISILGTAQNDYGATKDTHYKQRFHYNPKLTSDSGDFVINGVVSSEQEYKTLESRVQSVDYRNDRDNQYFSYKYVSIDGEKLKMKGEVFINDNYFVITTEPSYGSETPVIKSPLFKNDVNENEWNYKYAYKSFVQVITYNSLPNKYKSTGGTLIMESAGSKMIYYLVKK